MLFRSRHTTTRSAIANLKKTQKLADKQIDVFYIFDNISDNLKDYSNPSISPLYIAMTHEEATAACARLLYLKHIDHYMAWCGIHDYTPGINEDSWWDYMETVQGGFNKRLLQDFKIVSAPHSFGDLMSIFRAFSGSIALLGLPTETPGETMAFMERAVLDPNPTAIDSDGDSRLLKINSTSGDVTNNSRLVAPLANILHCDDVGEYLGKMVLLNPSSFTKKSDDSETPGIRDAWKEAVSKKGIIPPESLAVYKRALSVADTLINQYTDRKKM